MVVRANMKEHYQQFPVYIIHLFVALALSIESSDCNQVTKEDFSQHSHLSIVSIRFDCQHKNDPLTHCCNGIILTESYILTTANCIDQLHDDNLTIVARFGKQSVSDRILIHPNWTSSRDDAKDNIALLHTSTPLDITINRSISRSYISRYSNDLSNSTRIVIVSRNFNGTMDVNLQENEFVLIGDRKVMCHGLVDNVEQQVCVRFYHSSSCDYEHEQFMLQWFDGGWIEVGVISSIMKDIDGHCLKVFTKLGHYEQWIESILLSEKLSTFITANTYQCNRYKVPCGCSAKNVALSSTRIIGGEEAVPHSWGMVVSIRLNDSIEHSCGGSIISPLYVLTSAHCVENGLPLEISIIAGVHNRIEDFVVPRYVRKIFIHPDWNRNETTYQNDIALLYVFPPLPVDGDDNFVRTCLPHGLSSNEILNYPSSGSRLAMVGWGSSHNDDKNMSVTLQQTSIYVLDTTDPLCSETISDTEKQFCAGRQRKDSCYGDEGSPIFQWKDTYWEQVGITSYGEQCNSTDSPSIFTRLAYYFDWMESVTNISLTTTTTKPPPVYSCNRTSSCGCGQFDVALTSSRIVGGEDAIEHSWPMIVSVRLQGTDSHSCGGTIVSRSYVMTAAHCLRRVSTENSTGITIAAGMTNRSDPLQIIRNIDRIYIHPNYTGDVLDYRHDIALLHVDQPFIFGSNTTVTKTCIHRIDPPLLTSQHPRNGTRLAVIGWGTLWSGDSYLPSILQQVEVFTIDNEDPTCLNIINNTEIQFCAGLFDGGKDSCQGDSGGPIFQWSGQYWEQVGIVSYGDGCAQPGLPGVYTRLSYYYHWIEEILELDGEHLEPQIFSSTTSPMSSTVSTSSAYKYSSNILIIGLSVLFLHKDQIWHMYIR